MIVQPSNSVVSPLKHEKFLNKSEVIAYGSAFAVTCVRQMLLMDPSVDNLAAKIGIITGLVWDILQRKLSKNPDPFDPVISATRLCGFCTMAISLQTAYRNPHIVAHSFAVAALLLTADKIFASVYKKIQGREASTTTPLLSLRSIEHIALGGIVLSAAGLVGVDLFGEQNIFYLEVIVTALVLEVLREKRALCADHPSAVSTFTVQVIVKIPVAAVLLICGAYMFLAKKIFLAFHRWTPETET